MTVSEHGGLYPKVTRAAELDDHPEDVLWGWFLGVRGRRAVAVKEKVCVFGGGRAIVVLGAKVENASVEGG